MIFVSSLLSRAFRWHVPSYVFLPAVLLVLFLYMRNQTLQSVSASNFSAESKNSFSDSNTQDGDMLRLKEYKLTGPLLLTENNFIASDFSPIKERLNMLISTNINLGNIETASVFLRKLNESGFVSINQSVVYNPGSMMKIPIMMTCLKQAMEDPSILKKKLLFVGPMPGLLVEEGSKAVLKPGNSYPISELIEFMIIDSDNESMALLFNFLGQDKLDKIFIDLEIKLPRRDAEAFNMNTSNFARFLTVLYNATYLDVKNSEWALSTLSKAKYNKGITNSLPKEITVAHKYGVATSGKTNMLSESAIIYPNGDPYIMVVMTKGTAFDKQAGFISDLSAMVYGSLSN